MSSSSDAFRFPKLKGSNYAEWSTHMQSALQSKFFWLIVTGREPCPDKPSDESPPAGGSVSDWKQAKKDWLEWQLRDEAAQGLMKGAAEISQWPHVRDCKSSKEIWDTWKKVHVTNQQSINVHYFFEELYTRKYSDGTPMADHIASMLDLRYRIEQSGEEIKDIHIARALVLSLPRTPTWEVIKIQLFNLENLTSEIVSTKLQAEANRRLRDKSGGDSALFAQSKGKKGKGNGGGGGKGKSSSVDLDKDECRYCHEKGHWANQCPKRKEKEEKKKGGGDSANLTVSGLRDLGTHEVGRVYMATNGKTKPADVILDCGASAHMFCDRAFFRSYTASTTGETISVGDARNVPVRGSGSVTFRSRLQDGYRTVVLHRALHVPNLAANLVSLGTLQLEGAEVRSYRGGLSVSTGADELFRATLTGTLYYIDRVHENGGDVALRAASSGSLRLWHRRLGHLNLGAIRELSRKQMVDGLTITAPGEYDHVCEGCVLGKSHRLPFPKASTTTYEKMELVVTDLTGPMSVSTWTGMEYALVVIDASTPVFVPIL